ncbi:ribosomal protection-like ABC-F family protein [Oceanobacillus sp. Castelsardo]|uniref:ribosomal protection-like ABC-F family protein n=1 Tax=Oceanobacillus sp. Castelsardo TaxID=1851204 RepID=UPI0008387480|nr:ABC-F type ribosomal protection protein [Oceanobacillus sp. Castelsardo]
MREMLKLMNITYEIKDTEIFRNVNATVHEGDIIAVIGKNGAGKTTLLELIQHRIQPTKGRVNFIEDNIRTVMVEQETKSFSTNLTSSIEAKLLSYWNVPENNFKQLSGGERLKARLANGLSKQAELLLLDEPTNHLDEESMELLIKYLQDYKGTIIFVSHDRYFMNAVATKIWSLEDKSLTEHIGNYSSFIDFRKQRRLSQQRAYDNQQKMKKRIEGQINELTSWSNKAHAQSTKKEGFKEYHRKKAKRTDSQIKSKQKRLEKELEKAKVDQVNPEYTVQFSIKANNKVGKRFLEVKDVSKTFHDKVLFEHVQFFIKYGEKVALVGPNGSGKTTLLKMIMGIDQVDGEVWISPSAKIGYLTQEIFDLPLEKTPEELFHTENFEDRGKVQNAMKHLGFRASQWNEPIKHMSMGERVKCKLLVYILEERDVLILDEPTNHLDLPSREQLEETLTQYNGTLIVVSHDRYFLEKITDSQLIIVNKSIQKKLNHESSNRKDEAELLLKLETERQEVLGRLSFLTPSEDSYIELDERFKELTKKIQELKSK